MNHVLDEKGRGDVIYNRTILDRSFERARHKQVRFKQSQFSGLSRLHIDEVLDLLLILGTSNGGMDVVALFE